MSKEGYKLQNMNKNKIIKLLLKKIILLFLLLKL